MIDIKSLLGNVRNSNVGSGILGVAIGVAAEGLTMWKKLLLYTEATSHPLLGGGIIGFLLGTFLGLTVRVRPKWIVAVGVMAVVTIAVFDGIVYGEVALPWRALVLYLLGFFIATFISFLSAKVGERLLKQKQTYTDKQATS